MPALKAGEQVSIVVAVVAVPVTITTAIITPVVIPVIPSIITLVITSVMVATVFTAVIPIVPVIIFPVRKAASQQESSCNGQGHYRGALHLNILKAKVRAAGLS
ncbi:hypothetical protein A1D17_26510 [Pseudomonas fluorescens]|uniref:Uncharacterized protein n=1 Tax=Pseudomonas fluorescens TaxID=294 RepID=A0A166PZW4_PSEFL|nr:hypothetical protein A1D17_26510 [Pseudomonas fluorescens]